MKLTKLIGFVAVGVVIPGTVAVTNSSAWAGETRVRTPNVEAITRSDGSVYVNTGDTTVEVPSRRRYWTPWRYWRLPWQSNVTRSNYSEGYSSKCRQASHQSTSRVGNQVVQSSLSSDTCN